VVIAGIGLAVCGLGQTTAASGGVEVVVTVGQRRPRLQNPRGCTSRSIGRGEQERNLEGEAGHRRRHSGWGRSLPAEQGTYSIAATSVADLMTQSGNAHAAVSPPGSNDPSGFLPADRATWNPGMMGIGGIPVRSTVCTALTPRRGARDDTAQSQAAINTCPAGQVVQLAADGFIINGGNFLLINKAITLRGAGPGQTMLAKTNGAKSFQEAVSAKPSPLIIIGPYANGVVGSTDLTADAHNGAYVVTVASAAGFSPGQRGLQRGGRLRTEILVGRTEGLRPHCSVP
jgi:hypothetical protein